MKKQLTIYFILALASSCSRPLPESLYPAFANGKWGFVDSTGHVVIEPRYELVMGFRQGLAWVLIKDSGWTMVDRQDRGMGIGYFDSIVVDLHPSEVRLAEDHEGLFVPAYSITYVDGHSCTYRVAREGRWGIVDEIGGLVIPAKFEATGRWSDGLAWFRENGKYGFVDRGGVVVIPAKYLDATDVADGRAWVRTDSGFGMIDRHDQWVSPPRKNRTDASMFVNGRSLLKEVHMVPGPLWSPRERMEIFWTMVDTAGKRIPFNHRRTTLAHGWSFQTYLKADIGPAGGVRHTTHTIVSKANAGPVTLPDVYFGFAKLSEHLMYVQHYHDDRKWGIIRVFPDSLSAPSWFGYESMVYPEQEGIILVMKREWIHVTTREGQKYVPPMEIRRWGAMDSVGNWIAQPDLQADSVWAFHQGVAKFIRGGKFGILDTAFTERVKPEYDVLEKLADDRWGFRKEGISGLMDTGWRVIATGGWTDISPFDRTLAAFRSETDSGYVDKTGRVVWMHASRRSE